MALRHLTVQMTKHLTGNILMPFCKIVTRKFNTRRTLQKTFSEAGGPNFQLHFYFPQQSCTVGESK